MFECRDTFVSNFLCCIRILTAELTLFAVILLLLLMLGFQQKSFIYELHHSNGNQLPVWLQHWCLEPASWCKWKNYRYLLVILDIFQQYLVKWVSVRVL